MTKKTNKNPQKKVNWADGPIKNLFTVLIAGLALVICRYGYLQTVDSGKLTEQLNNYAHTEVKIHIPRGTIYDANMKELAVSTTVESLFIDAIHLNIPPQEIAAQLSPIIEVPPEEIQNKIAEGGGFIYLKRQMSHDMAQSVHRLIEEHPDYNAFLGFVPESKRFYPNDMLAANVIGFVGDNDIGWAGIEQEFDDLIKGEESNKARFVSGIAQNLMGNGNNPATLPKDKTQKNIQLTINAQYQFIVEKALDKAMEQNKPTAITAIVMDPKTGDILAMASRPSFNPNTFYKYTDNDYRNRAVTDIYEPGSVFKAFVAGAGFQEGLVKPTDVFVDPGVVTVSGHNIKNWSDGSFGTITFLDVVKNSINTGFALLGLKLGGEKLMDYAKKFGFGSVTGVSLPGEAPGILFDNPSKMADSDIATTAIGQSIAVTPLQMIRGMSAIANGGVLMKPHIVKAIYNSDDTIYKKVEPEEIHRVLDPEVDKTLIGVLEQVVATGGGSKAKIQGYHIAGKTGTAQKLDPVGGGYLPGTYIASFCGFGPVEDPRFTVLVVIDNPTAGAYYGGLIAAPVAHDIFLQLFRYANIKPVNGNESLLDGLSKDVIHLQPQPQNQTKPKTEDNPGTDEGDEEEEN